MNEWEADASQLHIVLQRVLKLEPRLHVCRIVAKLCDHGAAHLAGLLRELVPWLQESMVQDIRLMKQLNFNAVRCSHYPNASRWCAALLPR